MQPRIVINLPRIVTQEEAEVIANGIVSVLWPDATAPSEHYMVTGVSKRIHGLPTAQHDNARRFIDTQCIAGDGLVVDKATLFTAYAVWCHDQELRRSDIFTVSKAFSFWLLRNADVTHYGQGVSKWSGITLKV